ncbi:hypothetical protein Golax_022224, partial [Gossypium laxum]|nr:hypothetical protein [Gossypium laxum]
ESFCIRSWIAFCSLHQPASSFYEAQTGEFILEAEELLKASQGFMYKERARLYGLYPKTWKEMFLCL